MLIINSFRNITKRAFSLSSPSRTGVVPLVLDNDGRVERFYDIYSRLLKDRIICVMSQINDYTAASIIAQLLFLQGESGKSPINMYINCPGCNTFLHQFQLGVSIGQACSMGSLLLAAGEKGMRVSLPNARIMVHQPSGGAQGMASDVLIMAEELSRNRERLNEIYAHHTGQTVEKIAETLDRDRFMSASEALEFGLIDRIENHNGSSPAIKI
uniref:ATP-dependent Clp protease proteolytic subunit n=1 Tax=Meloidogyne floridensis TaxID=298350 RepID=A0A915NYW8_9BILA